MCVFALCDGLINQGLKKKGSDLLFRIRNFVTDVKTEDTPTKNCLMSVLRFQRKKQNKKILFQL